MNKSQQKSAVVMSYEEHIEQFHKMKMETMREEHNKKMAILGRDMEMKEIEHKKRLEILEAWLEKVKNIDGNCLANKMGVFLDESEISDP